jgi:hypothetical protein
VRPRGVRDLPRSSSRAHSSMPTIEADIRFAMVPGEHRADPERASCRAARRERPETSDLIPDRAQVREPAGRRSRW